MKSIHNIRNGATEVHQTGEIKKATYGKDEIAGAYAELSRECMQLWRPIVRVSLGIENNEEDVDKLIHSLRKITQRPRASSASKEYGTHNLPKADVKQLMKDFVRDSAGRVFPQL